MNRYLYAAYGLTWVIHIVYVFTLNRRASRLRREAEELHRER